MTRKKSNLTSAAREFSNEQKYREFAAQYLLDFKAIAAYRRCNFKQGEPKASDSAAASKLLATPEVQQYIEELAEERQRRFEVKVDRVVQELALIGFADIANYFEWTEDEIRLKPSAMLDPHASRCIERLDMVSYENPSGDRTQRVKIKLHSKTAALESLAKYLKMYVERHDISVNHGTVNVPAMTSPQDWMEVVRQEIAHANGNNGEAKISMEGQ